MWPYGQPRLGRVAAFVVALVLAAAVVGCGDGKLDPTFDGDGRVTLNLGPGYIEEPTDLAIDPKGRIVITGWLFTDGVPVSDGFVARLLPDGSPDPRFNGGEPAIVDVPGSSFALQSVAIDTDRRIVVAGASGVARLLPDGKPDPSFSGDGVATLDYGSGMSAAAVTLDDQGRIVLGGSSSVATPPPLYEFAAARLLANGSPDPVFAGGGIANPRVFFDSAVARAIAVDDDGRIILAGGTFDSPTSTWQVLRLLPGGSLDESFGDGGLVEFPSTSRSDALHDMALDPQGRIVLAGILRYSAESQIGEIGVARLLPSGELDSQFGEGGRVGASGFGNLDFGHAVAIDPAGRVVVAGFSVPPRTGGAIGSALLARFTGSGAIDRTFGAGGFIRLDYRSPTATGQDDASALGIDDSGRYVIAGHSRSGLLDSLKDQMGVARFTIDYPVIGSGSR
jgi:uncharacterized delta-60 repeat protein